MTRSRRARPEVRVAPDPAGLARLAAEELARRAGEAARARGRFDLALSGGSTPGAAYALLADPGKPWRSGMPWDRIHFFFSDERMVPPDHPDSNFRMACEALLDQVPVAPAQVHRVRGELSAPEAAAEAYAAELARHLASPPGAIPRLDLVLLGMGADGHVASLFPGGQPLAEMLRTCVAALAPDGSRRVTLTLPVLEAARAVLLLVAGEGKAARVAEVLEERGDPRIPARLLSPAGDYLWLLDAAAAARLAPRAPDGE